MWNRRVGVFVVVTAAMAVGAAACGGSASDEEGRRAQGSATPSARRRAGGGTGTPPTSGVSAGTTSAKPICPPTGAWQLCSVIDRLERAGFAVRREPGPVREAPLSAPGVPIRLGRSELRVFVYSDRTARERDEAKLDRRKYLTASEPVSMRGEPTLIVSENLLAILRSRSDHQRERVSDALTAGPPQRPGTNR